MYMYMYELVKCMVYMHSIFLAFKIPFYTLVIAEILSTIHCDAHFLLGYLSLFKIGFLMLLQNLAKYPIKCRKNSSFVLHSLIHYTNSYVV